jgi:hypothetical protein
MGEECNRLSACVWTFDAHYPTSRSVAFNHSPFLAEIDLHGFPRAVRKTCPTRFARPGNVEGHPSCLQHFPEPGPFPPPADTCVPTGRHQFPAQASRVVPRRLCARIGLPNCACPATTTRRLASFANERGLWKRPCHLRARALLSPARRATPHARPSVSSARGIIPLTAAST